MGSPGWFLPPPALCAARLTITLATSETLEQTDGSQQCHTAVAYAQSAFFLLLGVLCRNGQVGRGSLAAGERPMLGLERALDLREGLKRAVEGLPFMGRHHARPQQRARGRH